MVGRSLYSCLQRDSDSYLVFKAANPVGFLDQCTQSAVLVDRINKTPKLNDTVVDRDANVAVIDPGLSPDAVMEHLMQGGVIDLLGRLGNLHLAQRTDEITAGDDANENVPPAAQGLA